MVFKLVFQQNKQGTEHSERITKLISQTEYMEYGLRVSEHRYWNGSYDTLLPACVLRAKSLRSCLTLCNPWTVACQTPLSMGFSRQEYWSGLPLAPQGGLPDPGIEPASLMSPALAGRFFTTSTTWEACYWLWMGHFSVERQW